MILCKNKLPSIMDTSKNFQHTLVSLGKQYVLFALQGSKYFEIMDANLFKHNSYHISIYFHVNCLLHAELVQRIIKEITECIEKYKKINVAY